MAHGRDTEGRMHNSFKALVETVLFVFLQMILMATLCKLGIMNPSHTSPVAPLPNTLLTMYLLGRVAGWRV